MIKNRYKPILNTIEFYVSFWHIKCAIGILVAAVIMLIVSAIINNSNASSFLISISTGLLTGVTLLLVTGLKSAQEVSLRYAIEWYDEEIGYIDKFHNMLNDLIKYYKIHKTVTWDDMYDISIALGDIYSTIERSENNERLVQCLGYIPKRKLCKDYDVIIFNDRKIIDDFHFEVEGSQDEDMRLLFIKTLYKDIREIVLNLSVAMRQERKELCFKLDALNRTII